MMEHYKAIAATLDTEKEGSKWEGPAKETGGVSDSNLLYFAVDL